MFRSTWSRCLPKLHFWRSTWLHGLHATTLVPGRRITFFRLLLSSSKLCSNWQLTACCLQLPARTLNAKLTISSCQNGVAQIQTHAHDDDDFGEREKRRERRKIEVVFFLLPFFRFVFPSFALCGLFCCLNYFCTIFLNSSGSVYTFMLLMFCYFDTW